MLLVVISFALPHPAAAALTEGSRLAAVYDLILGASFDEAEARLRQTCPPAPDPACKALATIAVWWRIALEPSDRSLDEMLKARAAEAVAASTEWTMREPDRGEAWFYLAGSYAPLVQWHALRGQRVAAARNGKRIKDALERAIDLDPQLDDAYFGIGLYHYYADVAPMGAKILRWLLLLPGGDRVQGLREMVRARDHGQLMTGEADYQLQQVYLAYEHNPTEALRLLQQLDARFPSNPHFLQRIAEIQSDSLRDHTASAATWQRLLTRAERGEVYMPSRVEMRARLAVTRELDAATKSPRP